MVYFWESVLLKKKLCIFCLNRILIMKHTSANKITRKKNLSFCSLYMLVCFSLKCFEYRKVKTPSLLKHYQTVLMSLTDLKKIRGASIKNQIEISSYIVRVLTPCIDCIKVIFVFTIRESVCVLLHSERRPFFEEEILKKKFIDNTFFEGHWGGWWKRVFNCSRSIHAKEKDLKCMT